MEMIRELPEPLPTDWLVRQDFQRWLENLVPSVLTVEESRLLRSAADRGLIGIVLPTYKGDKLALGFYVGQRDLVLRSLHGL